MAKLRNRLVHLYRELDPDAVYDILQNNLGDFEAFQDAVVGLLNRGGTSGQS